MWQRNSLRGAGSTLVLVAALILLQPGPSLYAQDDQTGSGADLVRSRCTVCHGRDMIAQQRLSPQGWVREVEKMIGWGAALTAQEKETLGAYLADTFARTEAPPRPPAAVDLAGAMLVQTRCHVCHDNQMIAQQRLTAADWSREVQKMIGWGANVSAAEREVLVAYLASMPIASIPARSRSDQ